MKTLSVKQPWAYLLCTGIKDIENRTWKLPEKYRGERILIHASGSQGKKYSIQLTDEQMVRALGPLMDKALNGRYDFGAIIGSVRFVDCVINHPSIWAEKSMPVTFNEYGFPLQYDKKIYNWTVSDPVLFDKPILNVKGKLGFWESYHEPIICPNCGQIQCAIVEDTTPFMTYIHECEKCGYVIMESEWNRVK